MIEYILIFYFFYYSIFLSKFEMVFGGVHLIIIYTDNFYIFHLFRFQDCNGFWWTLFNASQNMNIIKSKLKIILTSIITVIIYIRIKLIWIWLLKTISEMFPESVFIFVIPRKQQLWLQLQLKETISDE